MYLVENTIIDRRNKLPLSYVSIRKVLPSENIKQFESLRNKDIHRDIFNNYREAKQFANEIE
jgi:hypothetical protein|tara:strand:- start:303 stop:488 length:186 start_codon:yes stop_codon:yes gene_type:complete